MSPDRPDQPDHPGRDARTARDDRPGRRPRPDDAFPSTHDTWIRDELAAGDERRRALRSVIMGRYFEPLRIYVKGSSYGPDGGMKLLSDAPASFVSLTGTQVCNNLPRPNINGRWIDLGGNTVCECVGDVSGDGQVNGADIGVLLSAWGSCGITCPGDLNRDGMINGFDLGLLLANWGPCAP